MFRVIIHKAGDMAYLRSGSYKKMIKVTGDNEGAALTLAVACKALIRDRLNAKYGKSWRNHEQPKQVYNSIYSAIKRMQ